MEWIEKIGGAIGYIEENIVEELSVEDIAKHVFLSPFYFQKGFSMLCGFTPGEYVRQRRLSLAGIAVLSTEDKIIDIALKYGYESPDSFTKAFTRFHGVTPSAARRDGTMLKSFGALKIKFTLEGGSIMDYKIVEKDAFTVVGVAKTFNYEGAMTEIPDFWTEHYQTGKNAVVCGMYGVCLDEDAENAQFTYLIADDYDPAKEVPPGFETRTIPKHTWAIFPCKGPMPAALQTVNQKIFSEWLPNCKEYEIAAGLNVEMYSDAQALPKGTQDENYYSEIWIPVRKKQVAK